MTILHGIPQKANDRARPRTQGEREGGDAAPVLQTLKGFFPNLEILALPQLEDEDGVCTAMLIATEVAGKPTGKYGFLEKLKTYPVLVEHSSLSQKWASSTTGFLLFRPFAIARMTGIQAD